MTLLGIHAHDLGNAPAGLLAYPVPLWAEGHPLAYQRTGHKPQSL